MNLSVTKILFFMIAVLAILSSSAVYGKTSKKNKLITEKQAVQIAFAEATKDEYHRFPNPVLESASKVKGDWVVKLRSNSPNDKEGVTTLGGYYFHLTIDGSTGKIMFTDTGGGS
jgi:hypothetical protein